MRHDQQRVTRVIALASDESRRGGISILLDSPSVELEFASDIDALRLRLDSPNLDAALLEVSADQPEEALQLVQTQQDLEMAGVPLAVLVHGAQANAARMAFLGVGAGDVFTEPANGFDLLSRLVLLGRIRRAENEFRELAITDRVTGLFDQRYFYLRLMEEISRSRRFNKPLGCLMLALDAWHSGGAGPGDLLLRQAAIAMQSTKRDTDVLARLGKSAVFGLLLYGTDTAGGQVLLGRIRRQLKELVSDDADLCSVSAGITTLIPDPEVEVHPEELRQQAELALRQAQSEGGGADVIYTPELARQLLAGG